MSRRRRARRRPKPAQADAARAAPAPPGGDPAGSAAAICGRPDQRRHRHAPLRHLKALNACLARHCPPAEDIRASLAHAENLFVAGRYRDAQAGTAAAVGRNKRFGKELPVDVSGLYRAKGQLAAHVGEAHDQEMSVGAQYGTLSSAFGKADPRVLAADVERGDMYVLVGREELARRIYDETEHRARAASRADPAGIARVRAAWLFQQTGDIGFARRYMDVTADASPAAKP